MKYKKGQELLLTKPYFNFEVGHKLVIKEVYPHSSQYLCALDGGYDIYLLEDYLSIKTPHQARLDKVLSKFKTDGDDKFYENGDVYLRYCIYRKKFGIGIFKKRIISLETVESLLKDLEEQDV